MTQVPGTVKMNRTKQWLNRADNDSGFEPSSVTSSHMRVISFQQSNRQATTAIDINKQIQIDEEDIKETEGAGKKEDFVSKYRNPSEKMLTEIMGDVIQLK